MTQQLLTKHKLI